MEFKTGPVGALTDLYERELASLKGVLAAIEESTFSQVLNAYAPDDFISVRSIMTHVVKSGFSYANHIRKRFNENYFIPTLHINTVADVINNLDQMFRYTQETLENKYHLTDDDLGNIIIKTGWGVCDLEALLEHAIMHIIRHRFQIEKLLNK